LVGLTAEKLFGFRGSLDNYSSLDQRHLAANSLAGALLVCLGEAVGYALLDFYRISIVPFITLTAFLLNLFQNKLSGTVDSMFFELVGTLIHFYIRQGKVYKNSCERG
jgi:hypothetical protein